MSTVLAQQDMTKLLGLETLSEVEQAAFLANVGELIIEAALLRLAADLTPDQQSAINYYLETNPEPAVFMDYLLSHHSSFEKILEEEIAAFKEECVAVLGRGAIRDTHVAEVGSNN